jgi:hypothetical protein
MADRPSVAGALSRADSAHQKIEDHERLCAERYSAINASLGDLKDGQKNHGRAAWGVVLALVAWMAAQLWEGRNAEPARPADAAAPAR